MHIRGNRMCLERHHQRGREWPWLRAQIPHLAQLNAGLFAGLTPARMLKVLPRFHESGRHRIQIRVFPRRIVLQQQTVLTVHNSGNHRRLDAWEQNTIAVRLVGATLRPSGERRQHGGTACGAEPLTAMPDAQGDRAGGLAGLPRVGVWCKSTQIHPIEPRYGLLQQCGLRRGVGCRGADRLVKCVIRTLPS